MDGEVVEVGAFDTSGDGLAEQVAMDAATSLLAVVHLSDLGPDLIYGGI